MNNGATMWSVNDDFDITDIFTMKYEDVMALAAQLETSNDPEKKKFAELLRQLDPTIFHLTPAENKLKDFRIKLEQEGVDKEKIAFIIGEILKAAGEKTVAMIVSKMNTQSLQSWNHLKSYEPNVMQQLVLLDFTSNALLGKSYDDLLEENLRDLIESVSYFYNTQKTSASLLSKLTEDQMLHVEKVFSMGQHELAIQLIYEFSNQNV